MNQLTLDFRTLTPLWTGGARRRCDQVRETGLLGSLRWWYEGVVRGLGGVACDPSQGGCSFDLEAYEKAVATGKKVSAALAQAGLCPACQLFGATGWKRRFRLEVTGLEPHPLFFMASPQVYQAAGNWLWRMFGGQDTGGTKTGRGAETRFTFGSPVLWGEQANLQITALEPGDDETLKRLAFLLDTVTRYGGLGAKTQNGFGQIKIPDGLTAAQVAEGKVLVRQDVLDHVERARESSKGKSGKSQNDRLFNLRNFFPRTYEIRDAEPYIQKLRPIGPPSQPHLRHYVPCAFDIRYKSRQRNPFSGLGQDFGLRPWFRQRFGQEVAERLFGGVDKEGNRSAGRIRVSHLFKEPGSDHWRLKIWGEAPPGIWEGLERYPALEEITQSIDEFIGGPQGMFPGSQAIPAYEFKPEEFCA